jgi:hypothetical protein
MEYGWDHGLGEIVTALVDAGLEIRSLREYPFVGWKLEFLVEGDDGNWRLPHDAAGELPLFFSILARKPGQTAGPRSPTDRGSPSSADQSTGSK